MIRCRAAMGAVALVSLWASGCGGADSPHGSEDRLLTPSVPPVIVADCKRAAQEMSDSVVYCPPLVPGGPTTSQNRSSRGRVSVAASGDSYVLNFVSQALEGIDAAQPRSFRHHLGHWFITAAGPASKNLRWLTSGYGATIVDRQPIAGVPVTIVERAANVEALDAGHVTVAWGSGERAMAVSLHGFEHRAQAVEMARALIAQARSCGARGGSAGPCRLVFPAQR